MHNGDLTRSYAITTCPPNQVCQADATEDEVLRPNETQVGFPARYPLPANPVAGALLYFLPDLPLNQAEDVAFQLRVFDLSRSATAAGTEIPVVRERDFRTSPIHLLGIPTDARFRLALRVFEMDLAHAEFMVRVIDEANNETLLTQMMSTNTTPGGFAPGFFEKNDFVLGASAPPMLRIEVQPLTTGAAFWAYVSITNNESQQITVVTPQ